MCPASDVRRLTDFIAILPSDVLATWFKLGCHEKVNTIGVPLGPCQGSPTKTGFKFKDLKPVFTEKNGGRGERIRTFDPLVPNQMRYQAALHPDRCILTSVALRFLGPGNIYRRYKNARQHAQ